MTEPFSRTELLIGAEGRAALEASVVAVFGLGGVGSFAVEALARAGIGGLVLVDEDVVDVTNLNRQLCALRSTIGRPKAEVMRERVLDIHPEARVESFVERYGPETAERLLRPGLSYVVDAIDSVAAKVDLIVRAKSLGLRIVSAMGAGNKFDPTRLEVADVYSTSVCPLARVMRGELRRRGVESLEVVYSREEPVAADARSEDARTGGAAARGRRSVPGSISFVPAAAGLIAASVVVRALLTGGARE